MAAILFVFDKSGSMSWGLDGNDQTPYGNRRIDFAKAALMDQLNRLSDQVPMGLILFPYLEPCDTTVAVTISRGHKGGIQNVISGVDAPWTPKRHGASTGGGGTPLAEAINLAGQVAEHYGGGVKVVVLTDGEETCGGDPVAVAQWWRRRGIDIQIHIVGFVVEQAARQQLTRIAGAGGGQYYDAQDSRQLGTAMERAVRGGGLRSAVSTTAGFARVMFATGLMLAVGAGMLLGGMILGKWLALSLLPGLVPYSIADPFTFLTPALSLVLFVLYMMPFIWDRIGNSSRFRWTTRVSGFIGTLDDYTRIAVAGTLMLATGYAMLWGGTQLGEWLTFSVLYGLVPYSIASLVTYLVPAIGLVFLVLYIAPWLWDRATDRGIPLWTYRAREFAGKLLRILIIVIIILVAVAIVLSIISE